MLLLRTPGVCLAAAILAACVVPSSAFADGPTKHKRPIDFSRDIQPILSNTCFKCHGFDEAERKAGLRLDQPDAAKAKLDSGAAAIVPGKSAESELIVRITSSDANEVMPPPSTGKKLTADQIDMLRRWIDEGAEWKGHWSFEAVKAPTPPEVRNAAAIANDIDRFIVHRVEQEGFEPSPRTDRITEIRRVTLDLTGLPPSPVEVDAYLADTAPDAYERLVDRLLASPRYGEHQGRYWLDAARFGDTHGLHLDNERSMWLYRDWVISAINANMPFDQFTIEQLAGDLLPNATREQRIATGFNRCNVSTSEGGSIDEEVLVRYAVDRVETTSTVFLGLTAGCAQCHDHKYDPITQRDFYRMYAFFSGAADAAMDGNALSPPPVAKAPPTELEAKLAELTTQRDALAKQVSDAVAVAAGSYVDPVTDPGTVPTGPREYVWADDETPPGASLQPSEAEWKWVAAPEHPVFSGTRSHTRTAVGLSQHFFQSANPTLKVGAGDKLFAYVYLDPVNPPRAVMLQFNGGSWEHRAVWGEHTAIPWGAPNTSAHLVMGPLPTHGAWHRLEVDAGKVGLDAGAQINGIAFTQVDGTVHWDKAGIVTETPQAGERFDSQLAWEIHDSRLAQSTTPAHVRDAIKADRATRTPEQAAVIRDYFLEHVCSSTRATFDPLLAQASDLQRQITEAEAATPVTLVMAEMPTPRDTFILVRGQYDRKADKVDAGVPGFLPPLPEGAAANRLGLAQWIVSPQNPLTSRVIVNRYWQQFFGTGIVKTSEDFGVQGQWPSHPELLDWLANEFVRGGWNVKALHRLIVLSNTYRQSSRITPDRLLHDPTNEWLSRGPRFRMDAEVVRDSALFVSGLLRESIGGRSVKPYQPEGLWESIAFIGSNTREFKRDSGDALYRRSLYTFWKRTCPPPSLLTFDAPSRETCTVRRARTNTPLQALVLMNDVQFVEAARVLAEHVMKSGSSNGDRAIAAFRKSLGRQPETTELAVLLRMHQQHLATYQADAAAATQLLSYGESPRDAALDVSELAAWTMVCNTLLNLDEFVTKE